MRFLPKALCESPHNPDNPSPPPRPSPTAHSSPKSRSQSDAPPEYVWKRQVHWLWEYPSKGEPNGPTPEVKHAFRDDRAPEPDSCQRMSPMAGMRAGKDQARGGCMRGGGRGVKREDKEKAMVFERRRGRKSGPSKEESFPGVPGTQALVAPSGDKTKTSEGKQATYTLAFAGQ